MINILLLVFFVCLLGFVLYIIFVFRADERRMRKEAPYVWSYFSHLRLLKKNNHKILGKSMIDMGCGDGWMLRFFTRNFGIARAEWYDIRRFPVWLGRVINYLWKYNHIRIYNEDFSHANLHKYDIVYLFLWQSTVNNLESRIRENIGENTVVFTNTFHFPNRQPYDVIQNSKGENIFQLYRK